MSCPELINHTANTANNSSSPSGFQEHWLQPNKSAAMLDLWGLLQVSLFSVWWGKSSRL